jgi:hypothetical protein
MPHRQLTVVVALGISLWFSRWNAAQDVRAVGLQGIDGWRESETDCNPMTACQTPGPEFAVNHDRGVYMLTSADQELTGPELVDLGCSDKACDPIGDAGQICCPCPCWTLLVEALGLQRDRPTQFGTTFPGSNDPSILNTNDLDFDFAPGCRLTLSRVCGCNAAWEISYFGIGSWSESASVTDPNRGLDPFLRTDIPHIPNFRNAFRQTIRNDTDLHSLEVNHRRSVAVNCLWSASVLAGFRYLHISDDFEYLSNDVDPSIDPTDIGLYTVKTTNDLVGGQIGGLLTRCLGSQFSAGVKLKAGLFANFAEQDSHLLNQQPNVPPSTDLFSHATKTQLSSVIETGVLGTWQFARNWGIQGGYDVFIVSGLALAPAQLDFTANTFHSQPFIGTSGTLVAHGPTIGLWHTW